MVANLGSIDQNVNVFIITALDLTIIDVSKSACDLFGCQKDNVLQKDTSSLFPLDIQNTVLFAAKEVYFHKKPATFTIISLNENFKEPLTVSLSPIFNNQNTIYGFFFSIYVKINSAYMEKDNLALTTKVQTIQISNLNQTTIPTLSQIQVQASMPSSMPSSMQKVFQSPIHPSNEEFIFEKYEGSKRTFSQIRENILLSLTKGQRTINQVANDTSINWKTVENHLTYLLGKNHVREILKSEYVRIFELTDEGKVRIFSLIEQRKANFEENKGKDTRLQDNEVSSFNREVLQ